MSGSSSRDSFPDAARGAAAVIVAGGSGSRMGRGGVAKQYLDLLGSPVLLWSVRTFLAHPRIGSVTVVLPPADAATPPDWLADLPVALACGGDSRGDSVRSGLAAVPAGTETVLVHDAARPLVSGAVIDRVLEAAAEGPAIAALPVADTIKAATPEGMVTGTVDRTGMWLAQTPQGFPARVLREVHERALAERIAATDDAALCERFGIPVRLVEGAVENMKITRPADFEVVAALAAAGGAAAGHRTLTGE